MDEIVLSLGQQSVSGFQLLLGVLGVIALLLVWLLLTIRRANRQRAFELSMSEAQNRARHVQVEEMQRLQAEMTGRMKNMAEIFSTR
ncbi:MAG: DNA recombination protein RmuC, partial [Cohaesibacter sp.]|nr:DNA recombination protein RmuC [Cohaesibacter sp.]